jgi:hypothetical protein
MTRRFWYPADRHSRQLFVVQPLVTSSSSTSGRIVIHGRPPFVKGSDVFRRLCNANDDEDDDEMMMRMINDDDVDNDIQSFDDLIHRLRRNELTLLRLGWTDSDYFSHHHSLNDSIHHHHQPSKDVFSSYHYSLATLERALRVNQSVRSISLGWRLSPNVLFHILTAITYHGIPLYQLRHVKIVVLENEMSSKNAVLPDTILTDLFHRQQKLMSIDLRSVQVSKSQLQSHQERQGSAQHPNRSISTVSTISNQIHCKKSKLLHNHKSYPEASHPGSVIMYCILQQYQKLSRLKSLSLIDCGVTGDIAIELAQFIHIRGGLAELSLRNNRKLSITSKVGQSGIRMICQAPIMRKLDLSLCDLDGTDIVDIAKGIAARTYPIGEIMLSGNYRMDSVALNALVQPLCCQKMVILDVSYCSITSDRLVKLFTTLTQLKSYNTLLRRIVLCGAIIANDAATTALYNLLLSDSPIRSLDLRDLQEPKPLSSQQIRRIADAMYFNYEMEEVIFDQSCRDRGDSLIRDNLDFYLQLNQVGRRIVRTSLHPTEPVILSSQAILFRHLNPSMRQLVTGNASTDSDWYRVLEKAGEVDNLDVLFWIVRHSGVSRFHNKKN